MHHAYPEQSGNSYNSHGGRLYCFLAGGLHQPIVRNMTQAEYGCTAALLNHTGVIAKL